MNQVKAQLPKAELPIEDAYVNQLVDKTFTDLKPWLREQVSTVIYNGYTYLKEGKRLDVVI